MKVPASLLLTVLISLDLAFATDALIRVRRDDDQQQQQVQLLSNGRRGKVRRVKKLRQQQQLGPVGNPSVLQTKPFPVARALATATPSAGIRNRQPKAIGFPAPQPPVPIVQQSPQQQPPLHQRNFLSLQQQQQLQQQAPASAAVSSFVPNTIPNVDNNKRPQSFSTLQEQQRSQLPPVPIHNQDFKIDDFGNYQFNFETGDQVQRVESGQQVIRNDEKFQAIEGSYSYTGPDGKLYTVRYIADENGFQPIGDHIPRLPKVPRNTKQ